MNIFLYILKVINSCRTVEQLEAMKPWVSTKRGLTMDEYFALRSQLIDKEKQLNPTPYLV